jgi:type I restriction enzyme, S subunit
VSKWSTKPLGEVCCVFTDGDWIESKDQADSGVRLIQTGNVGEGRFLDRSGRARYVSEDTFRRLGCTSVLPGDCLVSRLPEPVGRACEVPVRDTPMLTAVDCTIARFDAAVMLPRFFTYYSQSHTYLAQVDAQTTGTTRKRISRSKLGQIGVPLPPLPEQQRIVAILDEALTALRTARESTERARTALAEIYVRELDELFDSGARQWHKARLGDIAEFRNGINFTVRSAGERVNLIGVGEFRDNFWVPAAGQQVLADGAFGELDTLRDGDLLVVRSNGNRELVGRSMLARAPQPKTTHSGFTIRVRIFDDRMMPEFLNYCLRSPSVRRRLIDGGTGMSIKSLNQQMLSRLEIQFPSLREQAGIVERLHSLVAATEGARALYSRKLALLDELKRSLLHEAFSGNL